RARKMKRRFSSLALLTSAALIACHRAPASSPDMISIWARTLYGVMRVERLSPPVSSRLLAYASSALYSGLAVTDPSLRPLTGFLNGFPALPQPGQGQRYDGSISAVA